MATRLFGLGAGVFAIIFFFGLAAAIFIISGFTKSPGTLRILALAIVGLVILVVVATPKKTAAEIEALEAARNAKPRNDVLVFQIVLMVFMGLGSVLSCLGLCSFQAVRNTYAKPINSSLKR